MSQGSFSSIANLVVIMGVLLRKMCYENGPRIPVHYAADTSDKPVRWLIRVPRKDVLMLISVSKNESHFK